MLQSALMAMLLLGSSGAVARPPVEALSNGTECGSPSSSDQCAAPGTRGSSLMQFGASKSMALFVGTDEIDATGCSTLRWAADKCLDVADGKTDNGNNIQLWDCHDGQSNQVFLLPAGGEGQVRWAKHPTKCLDVAGGQRKAGTNLQLWDCVDNEPNQRFIVSKGSPGPLRWASVNLCVDVEASDSRNGNNILMWWCRPGASNQRFSSSSATCPGASPKGCCAPYDNWPLVDNGVTCGNTCTALVRVADSNGGKCEKYCQSFGHVCVAAAEEVDEGCGIKRKYGCNEEIPGTSDILCTCHSPRAASKCAVPKPKPTPAPRPLPTPVPAPPNQACCAPFNTWPSVDKVTCGSCRALVLTKPFGGRCDRYCNSFGHVCVAAAEEIDEGCGVKRQYGCNEEIPRTSDMLCTCHSPGAAASCAAPVPTPAPPSGRPRVEVSGRRLYVDGRPLHLKGVAWNPVPRGGRHPFDLDFAGYVERDAELMARAGINAVRSYVTIKDRKVLDVLWKRGIWVLNEVYAYGGDRAEEAVGRVRSVMDHPAILMWTVGNEWNYNGLYVGMDRGRALARVAEVAKLVKATDPSRPLASIYGEVPRRSVIQQLPEVDVWGINAYRGIGFGDLFDAYARRSGKPMFFGEYGADAFNANIGREDQAAQAKATKALTQEIVRRSAVRPNGVCLGGFVFEFADEWWKDGKGSPSNHDKGGSAPGGGPYPDRTFNEEWWGLVTLDRVPRKAFHAYAGVAPPVA